MKNIWANKLTLILLLAAAVAAIGCSTAGTANQANNSNAAVEPTPASAEQGASAAAAAQKSPDALVAELYKQHDGKKSPFFQDKDRALVDKYFAKPLADLIWKDAVESHKGQGVGAIDFDPLYNAQDVEIKNLKVGAPTVSGDKATIVVTFNNYDKSQTVKFLMVNEKNARKIGEIDYGDNFTLMKVLKENYSSKVDTPADGFFEGRYQVGDTTCTVKAVKMAFEVRWAKGKGAEMFFSNDGDNHSFSSETRDGGIENTFAFDDENYNTGTFMRADGKEFPIKRIK